MKYLLILEESQYNYFEKVDGSPLKIKIADKDGVDHLFDIRPIQREMVVVPNGASAYITQSHIDAMIEYEREQHIKEICDKMNHNLDGINEVDLPKRVPFFRINSSSKIVPDVRDGWRYKGDGGNT